MDSYHFSPELQTIWWPKKPHLWWHRDPPVDVGQDLWRPQPQPGGQPGAAVAVKGLDGKLCKAPLFRRRRVRGTFSKTIRLAPLVASGLEFLSQTEVCAYTNQNITIFLSEATVSSPHTKVCCSSSYIHFNRFHIFSQCLNILSAKKNNFQIWAKISKFQFMDRQPGRI